MTEVFHYLQSSPLNAFLFWREYFFCSITFAGRRSYRSPCQHGRMIYDDFGMCNSFYMLLPTQHSLFCLLKMPNIATSSFVGHFIERIIKPWYLQQQQQEAARFDIFCFLKRCSAAAPSSLLCCSFCSFRWFIEISILLTKFGLEAAAAYFSGLF